MRVDERQPVVVVPDPQGEAGDQDQRQDQPVHAAGTLVERRRRSGIVDSRVNNAPMAGHRARHAPSPQGDRARRSARAGQTSPNPMVGAVVVKDGRVIGEGITQPPGEAHAERVALGRLRGGSVRRDAVRLARAVRHHGRTPPCTDAILEAGIARVVIASDDPTDEGVRARPRDPARRGRRGGLDRRRGRRGRAAPQPAVPQARPHRPAAGGLQVGDDARRQGRHRDRRLAVDLRRGEPRPRAPLARRVGRGGGGHRHRAVRRPAADRPRRGRRAPAAPRRVRLRGAPAARLAARARRGRGARHRGLLARRGAHVGAGARVGRRRRDRRHRPERGARAWSTRSTSSARARSSRCCSRAARTWPARSSRPARSTRRASSSPRC